MMFLEHKYTIEDLVKRCKANERKAQELLYKQFASKMLGVCLRYATDRMEAEDMLQNGFIRVFQKMADYRGEGSFEGWVRRIFVNTAIEHFRRKTYQQPITERHENTVEGKYLSVLDDLAEKDIMKLIQELSPGYRTVFNLYVVEGYTHKEIGDLLNISEGTSKSQLSRAKVVLQDLVKTFLEERNR
jgi:RNA polymerase sigma-70 factor (ECF subfamily)